MRIYLTSTDRQIQNVCRDTFADSLPHGWTMHIANGHGPDSDADLYVWDVIPGRAVFTDLESQNRWRHVFLVDRSEVHHFREVMPFPDLNIVLKPITRTALAAFVSDACERCVSEAESRSEVSMNSLRADRDAILQCLMQTNLKLQEYDQDRTNFLARAIHDFRAPLTAVTGYCGLLLGEDLGALTTDQREVLERIQRSAKKLSRMANSMFQLSIAARTEAAVNLQKGEIRDCIERALHEVMPLAAEKQVSVSVDVCPSALYFEPIKLEQVIINLLDNACKFTPRGGSIDILGYPVCWDRDGGSEHMTKAVGPERGRTWEHLPNSYRVDVRDNGPGIPPSHLGKVFEEYTSYGGGVDRSGGGLGLAICRMILAQHHGRIWAESSSQGAMFSFILPLDSSGADANPKPNASRAQWAGGF